MQGKNIELASAMTVPLTLASRVLWLAGSVSCRSKEGNRLYANLFTFFFFPGMKSFAVINV